MSEVTRLLDAAAAGDRRAAADLLPLVYDELRRLAAARMAAEALPARPSTPTAAAVHSEAYLRLVGPADDDRWDGRGHFFAAAAEAMRRILVEAARRKQAEKHGGGKARIALEAVHGVADPAGPDDRLVALDSALTRLGREEPEVAESRQPPGTSPACRSSKAAAALGVSVRTANRHWACTRQGVAVPGVGSGWLIGSEKNAGGVARSPAGFRIAGVTHVLNAEVPTMSTPAPNVKAVFDRAAEIESPAQREAYVAEACAGRPDVRRAVESLLRAYGDAGSFLESGPVLAPAGARTEPAGDATEVSGAAPAESPAATLGEAATAAGAAPPWPCRPLAGPAGTAGPTR